MEAENLNRNQPWGAKQHIYISICLSFCPHDELLLTIFNLHPVVLINNPITTNSRSCLHSLLSYMDLCRTSIRSSRLLFFLLLYSMSSAPYRSKSVVNLHHQDTETDEATMVLPPADYCDAPHHKAIKNNISAPSGVATNNNHQHSPTPSAASSSSSDHNAVSLWPLHLLLSDSLTQSSIIDILYVNIALVLIHVLAFPYYAKCCQICGFPPQKPFLVFCAGLM